MKQFFLSPRWYGRLLGLLVNLAQKRGVKFENEKELTLLDLFVKVSAVIKENENEVINQLMKKWSEQKKYEDENHISVNKHDDKQLQERGSSEVSIILREGIGLDKLLEEIDFYAEEERRMAETKKKNARKTYAIYGVIAAIIITITIYNLPYFKELRFYNEVVKIQLRDKCSEYYDKFPEGRHYEDVMYLEISLTTHPIKSIMAFLQKFPKGKYANEMNARCDSLWDKEIAKYEARDKTKESPAAVKYMTEMLHHMKAYRINTIQLNMNPTIELKDYEEYDESMRNILEIFSTDGTLPLKGNVLSLKSNFTQEDEHRLKQILAEGVQTSFARMFSPDFVIVKSHDKASEMSPILSFNYAIKNRNEKSTNEIPNIWTYTSNGKVEAYILAIDVKFDVLFSIPNSKMTYTYSEIGEPGDEIRGIQDIKDGYRQMTQICFAKFSNKMSENLGLEEVYFKGEE